MILAIGHESEQGKDTFAMLLVNYLRKQQMRGLKIIREGFADRLYDLCYSLYKWGGFQTRQYYIDQPAKKNEVLPMLGKSPRDILIGIGNIVREFDSGAWLNAVIKEKSHHLKIIPDLRKVNEFEHLEANGAYRLKLIDPRKPRSNRESDVDLKDMPDHRWSELVYNDGTIDDLNNKVIAFADRVVIPVLQKYLHGELKV
jgi:hypothetical protein